MDVEATLHVTAPDKRVDGTCRNPYAAHVREKSITTSGASLMSAFKAKDTRYGETVLCAAVESFGLLSSELRALLQELATLATERDSARGLPQRDWFQAWILELSFMLARSLGQALLASLEPQAEVCMYTTLADKRPAACSASRRATAAAHALSTPAVPAATAAAALVASATSPHGPAASRCTFTAAPAAALAATARARAAPSSSPEPGGSC